jgi:hypothetical protein
LIEEATKGFGRAQGEANAGFSYIYTKLSNYLTTTRSSRRIPLAAVFSILSL